MKQPSQRNALIARIHVLKKELNLSDEEYHTILYSIGNKESCADLDDEYLNLVKQCMESMQQRRSQNQMVKTKFSAEEKKIAKLGYILGWRWHDIANFVKKETGGRKSYTRSCNAAELNKIINGMTAIIEDRLHSGALTLPQKELEVFLKSLKKSNNNKSQEVV